MIILVACIAVLVIGMVLQRASKRYAMSCTECNPLYYCHSGATHALQCAPRHVRPEEMCEFQKFAEDNKLPVVMCPNCGRNLYLFSQESGILVDMECGECGEPLTGYIDKGRQDACGISRDKMVSTLLHR
jgi:hypothetical protein